MGASAVGNKVQRFEDLIAWQRARELTRAIYAITRQAPMSRDFGFVSQIQRASVSVMSNIAEGFERGRLTEFHQFLSTAKGSCGEVRSQLYIALDAQYISQQVFDETYGLAEEVGKIIGGLRSAVARKRKTQRLNP
jgi:four helix bundle protein